jgi:hypothetical protein
MSEVTISLPAGLDATLKTRANAAGFGSKEDYLLALVRADCECAELEPVLERRLEGPFEPLEADWKRRVREAAQKRG